MNNLLIQAPQSHPPWRRTSWCLQRARLLAWHQRSPSWGRDAQQDALRRQPRLDDRSGHRWHSCSRSAGLWWQDPARLDRGHHAGARGAAADPACLGPHEQDRGGGQGGHQGWPALPRSPPVLTNLRTTPERRLQLVRDRWSPGSWPWIRETQLNGAARRDRGIGARALGQSPDGSPEPAGAGWMSADPRRLASGVQPHHSAVDTNSARVDRPGLQLSLRTTRCGRQPPRQQDREEVNQIDPSYAVPTE